MQGILVSVPSSGDGGGDRRFLLDDGTGVVELTLSPNFLNRDWKLGDYVMVVEGRLIRDDQLPLIKEIDLKNHQWGHYFICGYKGFHEYVKSRKLDAGSPVGLDVIIDGIVPTGSGLSSSAAFVCSATIAIMAAFNVNLPKKELAQLTW